MTPAPETVLNCVVSYLVVGVLLYTIFSYSKKGNDTLQDMISSHPEEHNQYVLLLVTFLVVFGWPFLVLKALLTYDGDD